MGVNLQSPFKGNIYKQLILQQGPLAYYRLGETSGTTAFDSSGHGNDGTYINVPTLGVPGALVADSNLAFTSVSSGIKYMDAGLLNATTGISNLTVSCWVNDNGTPIASQPAFFGFVAKGSGNDAASSWYLYAGRSSTLIIAEIVNSTPSVGQCFVSAPGVFNGAWHFLAMTYDGAMITLYIDGAVANTLAFTGTIQMTALETEVGNFTPSFTFDGSIDEAAIFTKTLSASIISNLYLAGITP